jgi:hypothetical protein
MSQLIKMTIVYLLLTQVTHAQPDRGAIVAERQTMVSEQRVALVIGNADYASGSLRNPVNDARAMSEALRGCRFDVIEKLVDRRETRRAIRDLSSTSKYV